MNGFAELVGLRVLPHVQYGVFEIRSYASVKPDARYRSLGFVARYSSRKYGGGVSPLVKGTIV